MNVYDLLDATITGLVSGATYYFTVVSYDFVGFTSIYDGEVVYTVTNNIGSKSSSSGANKITMI